MSDDGISREPMLDMYLFEGNQLVEQLEDIIIKCEKEQNFEKTAIEKNGYKQSDEKKNTKVSLSMTVEDYLDLIAFKNQ